MRRRWLTIATVAATVALTSSCDDHSEPEVGSIKVSVVTTGPASNPSGYMVKVDSTAEVAIATTGSIYHEGLPVGDHRILLSGLPSNCTAGGENPREGVSVTNGDTTDVDFEVTCVSPCGGVVAATANYPLHLAAVVNRPKAAFGCIRRNDAAVS